MGRRACSDGEGRADTFHCFPFKSLKMLLIYYLRKHQGTNLPHRPAGGREMYRVSLLSVSGVVVPAGQPGGWGLGTAVITGDDENLKAIRGCLALTE